jgi:hypothetical protein
MKKYYFFVMMLFAGATAFSQSLDDINKLMILGQNKKAKESVDKFLSDTKNATKADGWYYKGRVYHALSKDSGVANTEAMKLKTEAFEALKKYQQLDAKQLNLVNEQYASYFDMYNGFFDIGAKEFNNKNFGASFEGFKNALMVEEYVNSKGYEYKGFKFPGLDTSLILNTAIAAGQAKDTAASIAYYKKLMDAGVTGEQYLSVYQYVAEYYLKKKDEAGLKAAIDRGRSLYPNSKYWTELEIDAVAKTGNKAALMAKYEEVMKRYPDEYIWPYDLGVEIYNELYVGDKRPSGVEALKSKLSEVLTMAIKNDKGTDARMLMTRHLYNDAYDYQDSSKKIKGAKPEDIKKRNAVKAIFLKKIDECIPYGEGVVSFYAAQASLKPVQQSNYKIVLDILSQLYTTKGDLKKAAECDKKKTTIQ